MVTSGVPNMAMLNVNNILNVRDSRWLQLEVCREFQRNKCTRPDTECKFAHPPPNVEVQNGRVTACYDSIKGRCNREKPPCKYFHPPQHLKDQLLINGRNHLALKNALMTQFQGLTPGQPVVPGAIPVRTRWAPSETLTGARSTPDDQYGSHMNQITEYQPTTPYLTGIPTMANFNPYIASSPVMTMGVTDPGVGSQITGVVQQSVVPTPKVRHDRLEAFPGMTMSYKRPAGDKSGVPVYQPPGNAAYQQALMQQLSQQNYVPVSCEYSGSGGGVTLGGTPGDTTTSPATHSATASSKDPTISCSSSTAASTSSITNPSSPGKAVTPTLTLTSSSSMASGITTPMLPPPPVNVFSYAGYPLNKAVRPQLKPTVVTPGTIPNPQGLGGITTNVPPVSLAGVGLNLNSALTQMNFPQQVQTSTNPQVLMSSSTAGGVTGFPMSGLANVGGVVNQGMSVMPGLGGSVPMLSPSLLYSQYPASSLVLPTHYTALSSNPQSLTGAVEQPFKKLKTS